MCFLCLCLDPGSAKARDHGNVALCQGCDPVSHQAQPGQGPHICPCVQDEGLSELQGSSITQPLGTWTSPLQKPGVRSKEQASPTHGRVGLCHRRSMWEVLRKSRNQISLPLSAMIQMLYMPSLVFLHAAGRAREVSPTRGWLVC